MESFEVHSVILNFIKRKRIFRNRKILLLKQLSKPFKDFEKGSSVAFDELVNEVDSNPELIIGLTKEFLSNRSSLTKIFDSGRRIKSRKPEFEISYPEKKDILSDIYELSSVFAFLAYLLSNRKFLISTQSDSLAVFKYYKSVGISSKDVDDLRLIRNAGSHKYRLDSNFIYWDKVKIDLKRIDELHVKFEKVLSWDFTFFIHTFYTIPKFGILVLVSLYISFTKDSDNWKEYFKGLEIFYKDILTEIRNQDNQKRKENETVAAKKNVTLQNRYKEQIEIDQFILNNAVSIFKSIKGQTSTLRKLIDEICSQLTSQEEKQMLLKFETFLDSAIVKFDSIIDLQINKPDEFKDFADKFNKKNSRYFH